MYAAEILQKSKMIKTVEDIYLNFDLISDLIKEDVLKICKSKNENFADFDASFAASVRQTKLTLSKKHLKAIKKFYNCKNVKNAVNFLIQRIINNMKNAGNLKHKFAFNPPKFGDFNENYISKNYDIHQHLEIENMQELDEETLKNGLKKVWEDGKFDTDFDLQDFENLCSKYNVNLYDIASKEELEIPNLGSYELKNGAKQTFLFFDEVAYNE